MPFHQFFFQSKNDYKIKSIPKILTEFSNLPHPLWYGTSTDEGDDLFSEKRNEKVIWVKNYDAKEGGMGVLLYHFDVKKKKWLVTS